MEKRGTGPNGDEAPHLSSAAAAMDAPIAESTPATAAKRMRTHLCSVAADRADTPIAESIIAHSRFAPGVPADDETCVRMMRTLPQCGLGELPISISDDFAVDLCLLAAGVARDFDENDVGDPNCVTSYPECDRYGGVEKALKADFYETRTRREVGSIRGRATLEGFRQFIRDVRTAACTLRDSGLCATCPDRAAASMRLPRAKFCGECCFAVAILGDAGASGRR